MAKAHEQRIRISDPSVLSRYLPDSVIDHLLEADAPPPSDIDLGHYVARLQDLLQLVVSYVPEYVDVTRRALPAAQLGSTTRTHGTLLAADLSGFTAFSARLSTLGSEGAELVARTVSALFSVLLDTLAEWDGSLLKLSGDALTALFSGPDSALRAIAAAMELQKRMQAFQALKTPAGVFTLRIRIGLASGDVLLAQVGAPNRVEVLVAAAAARQLMEFQRSATPGAVVIGALTYREVAARCRVVTLASGLYRVLEIEPPERPTQPDLTVWMPRRDPRWELHSLVARIESLRPYLVDQHLSRIAEGPPTLAGEGDLRPVTVLFVCLSDASRLLERAAPGAEAAALNQVQASAQRIWAIVEQYGGTINKLDLHPDGHTLIALFGAPVAHGRDAQHAVSCALALLRALPAPEGDDAPSAGPLMVRRIGVATGRVFAGAVGSVERREYTVMGSVVNLAARLMDVAEAGQALIDVATARVVGRQFQLQAQPPVLVKGYDEPVPFYAVAVEQPARMSGFGQALEPLIGRELELKQAQEHVARALGGAAAIVALIGEAGIGKSRLLAEIMRGGLYTETPDLAVVEAHAQAQSRIQPYRLIADIFRQLYDLPDRAEDAAAGLADLVARNLPAHERFLPLLATIFGLPGEPIPLTQALTPDERRARLHSLAIALLSAHAHKTPTALVLEDLHWADAPSLEILGALVAASSELPLLLLCTYRPERAVAWPDDADLKRIELHALTPDQSQALIGIWMGSLSLSQQLSAAVVERTQGNPFFLEETMRALRERGLVADGEPPLPTTIQGALLARLDQLPLGERYILQIAATIGPLFEHATLAGATGGQVVLEPALERLADHGLVRHLGDDRYAFAHSLTQETVYESLLFAQRREIHRRVGDFIRSDREREDTDPGILAYHYRRAEAWPEALEYAWRAGVQAQALYASDIALGHYQQALDAADQLDGAAAQQRPRILRRIGDLHALAGRYSEADAAYAAALVSSVDARERADVLICWAEVCEQQAAYDEALGLLGQAAGLTADDEPSALRIAVRQAWVLIRQGRAEHALVVVEPCMERLEAQELWPDLLLAYKVFFHIALSQSRWSKARSYLRLALACAEQAGDIREIARIQNNLGIVLTQEGNLREAANACERAARVMEEIGDRNTLASVQVNLGGIYYKLGDFITALNHYSASLQIAMAIGAPPIESIVRSNLGEIYRRLGRLPESLEQLLASVELCRNMNDDLGLAEAYRQLAETYIALDQLVEAEATCQLAQATAIAAGDPQSEAIVYRVRSLLAAKRGDNEAAFEDARQSTRILAELGSTHELGQSMIVQATILLHEEQCDLASIMLKEAILLLEKAGAAADRMQAEQLLEQVKAQPKEIRP